MTTRIKFYYHSESEQQTKISPSQINNEFIQLKFQLIQRH